MGFPGVRGALPRWGERVCLGALCDVSVAGLFVTCEILGWAFFFFFFWRILVVNLTLLGDKAEPLFCV